MAQPKSHAKISVSAKEKSRLFDLVDRFHSAQLLVVGDFILDEFVWGQVNRISPEAPVPVVHVQKESFMPGGALNVANNIRSLGGVVYPCGVVGRDLYGRMLLKAMRREKIETGGVIYDRGRKTSLKTRVIAHSQQVVRFDRETVVDLKPAESKHLTDFIKNKLKDIQVIIVEDYGKGVVTPELIRTVRALAKSRNIPVLVDPKEKHFAYYKGVTAMTPNKKEALSGYGLSPDDKAPPLAELGKALLKKFSCEFILITLGEEGMALFDESGRMTHIPTTAREVYDVSGAGDTVISVLGLALAAGASTKEAAILSNVAAGVVVGKLGTATLDQNELKAALEEFAR